jgi:hypothetical protein
MVAKAKLAWSITFIVLVSFTIVTYDRQNMFIIQAIGSKSLHNWHKNIVDTKPDESMLTFKSKK